MPSPSMASISSPFSHLPRLVTSTSPPVSSISSPQEASVPLLFSSRPGSPARGHPSSRRGSVSPSSPTPISPFSFHPPPRATRMGTSSRRWVLLAGLLVVGGLAVSWSTGTSGEDGLLTEKWKAASEGLQSWTPWTSGSESLNGGEVQADEEGAQREEISVKKENVQADEPVATSAPVEDDSTSEAEVPSTVDDGSAGEEKVQADEETGTTEEGEDVTSSSSPSTDESSTSAKEVDFSDAFKLNVHPVPRPPPTDEKTASETKYISFENHSGFHNQRKSLVNALALAQMLNRTLLLPPARLGSPIPWGPEVNVRLTHSERCKAGLSDEPVASVSNSHQIGYGECDDPDKWTYVGWEYLVSPKLLSGRQLVDRWNSSQEWFYESIENGGLGLAPEEVRAFEDPERRSYQFYDSRATKTDGNGLFASRLDIEDLREDESRLLRFGSLFSGARMKLMKEENQRILTEANEHMILESEGLDAISDTVRDLLGSYVSAHARVGDGVFKNQAKPNMQRVFRKLVHNVLGLSNKLVDTLLEEFPLKAPSHNAAPAPKKGASKGGKRFVARSFGVVDSSLLPPSKRDLGDDEEDESDAFPSYVLLRSFRPSHHSSSSSPFLHRRGPSQPLASTLHCRSPLHDLTANPRYAPLNTPLYIATDSRSPETDVALAPFFRWFPCVFLLNDFSEKGKANNEPVKELVTLVEAQDGEEGNRWTSEWDGQAMAKYLYPFAEAEIAARGREVVGTPMSTFSGYTSGILHEAYVAQGRVANWDFDT